MWATVNNTLLYRSCHFFVLFAWGLSVVMLSMKKVWKRNEKTEREQ